MTLAVVLALALAQPLEVSEHWEFVGRAPLREAVAVWADYRRADGPDALLAASVQGGPAPAVTAVGFRAPLAVRRGARGWEVTLPEGARPRVRLLAQTVRTDVRARLFRLPWPPLTAGDVPTRRVAIVPRGWLVEQPAGWTCPEGVLEVTTCVSTARDPVALELRIAPAPAPRGWLALAAVLVAAVVAAAGLLVPRGERRRLVWVSGAAGALVGVAVALGVVGAGALGWAPALALSGVLGALLGALSSRNARASIVGVGALVLVPLVAVLDGRLRDVLVGAGVAAVVVVLASALPARPPAAAP